MLATLIIVFREVLEAGLVIGIVMAASRGIKRRGWWIAAGCAAGVSGAVLVAWFANQLTSALEGVGQELVGSANEVCGMKRAGMSVRVSAIFSNSPPASFSAMGMLAR